MTPNERELLWLRQVRDLCHLLAWEADQRKLLPMILDAAIELTRAERGFLVRVGGRKRDRSYRFHVEVARGFDKTSLLGIKGNVSRTVVKRVMEGGRGLVSTSEEDADVLHKTSVQERRVRSILCVPMCLRGEVRGVLYLDHRFTEDAFTERDLPILRTFADQAALALETAELSADGTSLARSEGPSRTALEPSARAGDGAFGPTRFGRLVGNAPVTRYLREEIARAARSWDPVLILGESGSGKELVAREIHARGSSPGAPFQVESCAALAGDSLPGSGKGAVFLDEVADLRPEAQSKLLQGLQREELSSRIVASTSRDLRGMVEGGTFRADLFYRLDVLRVIVPPLRQRAEDIPHLVEHFLEERGAGTFSLDPKAMQLLQSYTWPGNVRELGNEVSRLVSLGRHQVRSGDLSREIVEGRAVARSVGGGSGRTLGEMEREMVAQALEACSGNKSRAARQLGIPRSSLYHLMERHGLS